MFLNLEKQKNGLEEKVLDLVEQNKKLEKIILNLEKEKSY